MSNQLGQKSELNKGQFCEGAVTTNVKVDLNENSHKLARYCESVTLNHIKSICEHNLRSVSYFNV